MFPRGRCEMFENPHMERGDGPRLSLYDGRLRAPVDNTRRHMPHKIKHAWLRDTRRQVKRLLEEHDQPRTDSLQSFRRREQR